MPMLADDVEDHPPLALRHGAVTIDLIARTAIREGRAIRLSPIEFSLLAFLVRARGAPASRETLLQAVWLLRFDPGTNLVEVHMSRLRAKLDRGFAASAIETVKGRGYRLAGNESYSRD